MGRMSRFEEVDDQYEAHEVEDRVFDHWEAVDAYKKTDRKSTRLNSSHIQKSRMPSSA